jgi:aryl-phospho-beta-D-glucosidase BglC (GH1 family)
MIMSLLIYLQVCLKAQLTPQEAVLLMNRGINVGNSLDAVPTETSWGNQPIREYYFDDIKDAGFSCVRIPVTWNHHVANTSPYTIDSLWLDRVDTVVTWALKRGLFVTLNAHHEYGLKAVDTLSNPTARADTLARYDSIWSQVSSRFKDKQEKLFFEILNEPHEMSLLTLDSLNARVLSIIRKNNPTRIVLFSGTSYTGSNELMNAAVPDESDPYLMGYYHSYDPWSFAGEAQGTFGSTGDISTSDNRFRQVSEWSEANSIPVTLNECGAIRACEYNSRMVYYATYVEQALKYNVAINFWDDNGNFRLYDRNARKWDEFKDVIIYTYEKSPTRLNYESNDSSVILRWVNRTADNDSIVVEKLTAGVFDTFAVLAPQADSLYLPDLEKDVFHYFRLRTTLHDTLMYSYARRIKILTPDGISRGNIRDEDWLTVFPNPAGDQIVIRTDRLVPGAKLAIYSANGQVRESFSLTWDEFLLDLSGYERGVYFVRLTGIACNTGTKFIRY